MVLDLVLEVFIVRGGWIIEWLVKRVDYLAGWLAGRSRACSCIR